MINLEMKFQVKLIFLYSLACCSGNKQLYQSSLIVTDKNDTVECNNSYTIKSIYLNDTTYIIHAYKSDSLFKIVSPLKEPLFLPPMLKGAEKPCEELKEGKCYALEIHSLFEISGNKQNSDSSQNAILSFGPHRGAMLYNGSTITFDKESNYDLYYSANLRGKCYVKN